MANATLRYQKFRSSGGRRRKKEEGRRKKEEGRRKKEEISPLLPDH
jgi:hypothetical protein